MARFDPKSGIADDSLVVHICTLFLIILVNLKFTETDCFNLVRLFIYLNST